MLRARSSVGRPSGPAEARDEQVGVGRVVLAELTVAQRRPEFVGDGGRPPTCRRRWCRPAAPSKRLRGARRASSTRRSASRHPADRHASAAPATSGQWIPPCDAHVRCGHGSPHLACLVVGVRGECAHSTVCSELSDRHRSGLDVVAADVLAQRGRSSRRPMSSAMRSPEINMPTTIADPKTTFCDRIRQSEHLAASG